MSCTRIWRGILIGLSVTSAWQPFDELYALGLKAYNGHDWKAVVDNMYGSIKSYNAYKKIKHNCNVECRAQDLSKGIDLPRPYGVDFIPAVTLTRARCLQTCMEANLGKHNTQHRYQPEVLDVLESRAIYDFIQYAAYQIGDISAGASAAWTFSVYNPDRQSARHNLEFYKGLPDTTDEMFVLADEDKFVLNQHLRTHSSAIEFYHSDQFAEALPLFEKNIDEYFEAVDVCKSQCDTGHFKLPNNEYGYGYHELPDLGSTEDQMLKHWVQTVECGVLCVDTVAIMPGQTKPPKNYLPQILDMMQYSYARLGKIEKAAELVNTYAAFIQNNPVMKEYTLEYKRKLGGRQFMPDPRGDMMDFLKRLRIDIGLLRYAKNYLRYEVDSRVFDLFPKPEQTEDPNSTDEDDDDETSPETEDSDDDDDEDPIETADARAKRLEEETPEYDSLDHKIEEIVAENDNERATIETTDEANVNADNSAEPAVNVDNDSGEEPIGPSSEPLIDDQITDEMFGYYSIENKKDITLIPKNSPAIQDKYNTVLSTEHSLWIGPEDVKPTLVANDELLGHKSAHVVDDMISASECDLLMALAEAAVQPGDGYRGKLHPHNENEDFYGVTLKGVAEKVESGEASLAQLKAYYYLAERVRRQVMLHNNLTELYQDYVHLVCRYVESPPADWTEPTDEDQIMNHMSHPVHSDNCNLKPDGQCLKTAPAYTWREYSAIAYLNDEYTGGELVLTNRAGRRVTHQIEPKCGRMAAFCAGSECLHGVRAIKKGWRCALAQWFTVDYSRRDHDHESVLALLRKHDEL